MPENDTSQAQDRSGGSPLGRTAKVVVVTTGGTIGAHSDPVRGKQIGLTGEEAVAALAAGRGASVAPLWRQSSVNFGIERSLELADHLDKVIRESGADGVVATVGTDTLEEISFVLETVWSREVPCVVTGSMFTPETPGSDAAENVAAAIRVAGEARNRFLGVTVVLGNQVHSARYVYKNEPAGRNAFRSYGPGPIGPADGRALKPSRAYLSKDLRLPKPPGRMLPFVPMLSAVGGDDGRVLRAVAALRPSGVVICGTGAGNVSSRTLTEIGRLRSREVPIVLASRTGKPAIAPEVDGSPSRHALREMGCVFATALNGPKARILLTMLLANGRADETQEWMEGVA